MEEPKQRRLQILEETVATYNTEKLCRSNNGSCFYSPVSANKEGISPGCAVGRLMTPEEALELDRLIKEQDNTGSVTNNTVFAMLPENIKSLGQHFLGDLQMLHDDTYSWDSNGITEKGKIRVNNIKYNFELN